MRKIKTDCNFNELPKNLIQLKKLTEALDFAQVVRPDSAPGIKEFSVAGGTSYMVGLFKDKIMAVSRVYSSAGVEFPVHMHDEWELIIVYQGELHLKVEGKIIILKEKEFYYLKPGTSHGAYYPVDSWVLCITMPASEDFPEGS
ncbi:MAG: cupin domain-containing protein [Deltaproteobacteria bacterium]|nr:cupin domain-containing protein [Deltaproteobacteria bacterium]